MPLLISAILELLKIQFRIIASLSDFVRRHTAVTLFNLFTCHPLAHTTVVFDYVPVLPEFCASLCNNLRQLSMYIWRFSFSNCLRCCCHSPSPLFAYEYMKVVGEIRYKTSPQLYSLRLLLLINLDRVRTVRREFNRNIITVFLV